MTPHIGISPEHLSQISQLLNKVLADEFVLYVKTRRAHWNVEGPNFHSAHLFFQAQYEQLDQIMDAVAERTRMVGHYASATMKSFLSLTHLSERLHEGNESNDFIRELLTDHESVIIHLRENITPFAEELKDTGTSDFITGLMETHEKMAWMLRAHLK
jgi:starvation-inducible DNA-binding protein